MTDIYYHAYYTCRGCGRKYNSVNELGWQCVICPACRTTNQPRSEVSLFIKDSFGKTFFEQENPSRESIIKLFRSSFHLIAGKDLQRPANSNKLRFSINPSPTKCESNRNQIKPETHCFVTQTMLNKIY